MLLSHRYVIMFMLGVTLFIFHWSDESDLRSKNGKASAFSSTFASFTFSAQPVAAAGLNNILNQPKIKPYRNKVFIIPLQFFDIEGAPAAETLEFELDKIACWAVEVNAFLRFVSKLWESPRIILLTPFQISPSLVSPFLGKISFKTYWNITTQAMSALAAVAVGLWDDSHSYLLPAKIFIHQGRSCVQAPFCALGSW